MTNPIALTRYEETLEVAHTETKQPTVRVPLCFGCGDYHGSMTLEMNCLRDALVAARKEIAALKAQTRVEEKQP